MTKQMTQTTGDQKSARVWINKNAQYNLAKCVQAWLKYLATNCYWTELGKKCKVPRDFSVSHNTIAKNIFCNISHVPVVIAKAESLGFSSTIKGTDGKQDSYALHIDKDHVKDFDRYIPSKEIERQRRKKKKEIKSEWKRSHPSPSFEDLIRTPMNIERLRDGNQKPSSFLLNSKVECAKSSYAAVTALVQRNLSTQQEQNAS